jgi:hypothetical protein
MLGEEFHEGLVSRHLTGPSTFAIELPTPFPLRPNPVSHFSLIEVGSTVDDGRRSIFPAANASGEGRLADSESVSELVEGDPTIGRDVR